MPIVRTVLTKFRERVMDTRPCSDGPDRAVERTNTTMLSNTVKQVIAFVMAIASVTLANPAHALRQGTTNLGFGISSGRALDQTYTVIGMRLGYYVADGLEFAIGGELWRGDDPDIYKISPELRYVWFDLPNIKPYVGAFYARTIYDGLSDRNTYGMKGGVYMRVSPNAHLGAGLVYERIESCDVSVYKDCSELYPELSFNVSF